MNKPGSVCQMPQLSRARSYNKGYISKSTLTRAVESATSNPGVRATALPVPQDSALFDDLGNCSETQALAPHHHSVTITYGSKQHQNIQGNHAVQETRTNGWNFITAVKLSLKSQPRKQLNPYLLIH